MIITKISILAFLSDIRFLNHLNGLLNNKKSGQRDSNPRITAIKFSISGFNRKVYKLKLISINLS